MTSPLSRVSTGSFFSGVMREYSSLGCPGATVAGTNSILSIRPSSIAAMRTLRANGEAGEKESFMRYPSKIRDRGAPSLRAKRSNPSGRKVSLDCFVAYAPRNDDGGLITASRRDDFLPLFAQPLDAERDHVTDAEEFRRLHAGADAGRRARGDEIAGQQGEERRDVGNALRDGEDHGRGRAGLAALAVDVEPHREFLHVGNLVPGDQPRADRAERVVRFALGPLSAALLLEIAFRDVIADAVAGDVVEGVGLGDVFGAGADDGGDFDFPVEFLGFARLFDRVVRAAEGGVGLQEENRLGRNRIAGLLGVIDVVQADGDEFGDPGHGRAEPRGAADGRKLGGVEGGELGQRGRRIGLAIEVLDLPRQVAQLAGFVDQAGLFLANGPVTNKLHFVSLPGMLVAWMLLGTARAEIQLPSRIAG